MSSHLLLPTLGDKIDLPEASYPFVLIPTDKNQGFDIHFKEGLSALAEKVVLNERVIALSLLYVRQFRANLYGTPICSFLLLVKLLCFSSYYGVFLEEKKNITIT